MNNTELRILVREHQHVLQYRNYCYETRYIDGQVSSSTLKEWRWSNWIDVPIVGEE